MFYTDLSAAAQQAARKASHPIFPQTMLQFRSTVVDLAGEEHADDLTDFLFKGEPVGDFFVMSILKDSFAQGIFSSENKSIETLRNLAMITHDLMPSACTGSAERYWAWIEVGGIAGIEKQVRAQAAEAQTFLDKRDTKEK